jgi:multidrug transporter EmrE-like cation transporter
MKTQLWAIVLVLIATSIGSLGPLFLKKGSTNLSFKFKEILANKNLLLGIFFYGLSTLMFFPALGGGELSVLYPLVALVYVWVSFLSIRFLGEKMNTFKWLGILLLIIGVTLIGFSA